MSRNPGSWPAVLQHGDLLLRPLRRSDRRDWEDVRQRNQEWFSTWDATVPPGTERRPSSYPAVVRRLRKMARLDQAYAFVIEVEGRFAGQVTINNVVRGSGQFASIGYWIDQAEAGHGYVPLAVAMVIDHAFEELGLHRIEVCIRPENSNSLRVVEKLRIREVGYFPRFLHINGDWRDHRAFAITVEELHGASLTSRLLNGADRDRSDSA